MTENSLNRRSALLMAAGAMTTLIFPTLGFAKSLVSKTKAGVAIKGHDTTAYFQKGSHGKGSKTHVVEWEGAKWRFASAEEAALFKTNPAAYTPQFGGFCTRAMSFGSKVHSNPKVWRIYKDKLYLFAAPKGGKFFDKGQDKMIEKAQANWDNL